MPFKFLFVLKERKTGIYEMSNSRKDHLIIAQKQQNAYKNYANAKDYKTKFNRIILQHSFNFANCKNAS